LQSISSSNLSTGFASCLPYDDTGYPCSSTIRDNILPGKLEIGESKHAKANIACQTFGEETDEIQTLHINSQVNGTQQVITDIKSLKTTIIKLESMVRSLENTIKYHDAVLSLFSNAADLNVKFLKELNDNKKHIISLEEKLVKVEEERNSLQLAIRLIAQDKCNKCLNYKQRELQS
jgi:predicted RNase H-like nuclease (RuvC/YqgF family)